MGWLMEDGKHAVPALSIQGSEEGGVAQSNDKSITINETDMSNS